MVDEQLLKQLKVKTGVVKRTLKELTMYVKEEVREKERYEQKRAEGKSPNDLAQQEKVIQESTAMITDSRKRLSSSTAELKKIIGECEETDIAATEDYTAATQLLSEAEAALA